MPEGPTCGGETIEKESGDDWVCTFEDEFSGTALDRTKWSPMQTQYTGFTSGNECYVDDPDNIAVEDGSLRLTAKTLDADVRCGWFDTRVTTASVSTRDKFSQAFGRFEIRAKFQAVPVPITGLHGAIWLWPQASPYGAWPASGEIDIAEVYSVLPDRAIPALHYNVQGFNPNTWNPFCYLDPAEFHDYLLEWTTSSIRISFDGAVCLEDSITPAGGLWRPRRSTTTSSSPSPRRWVGWGRTSILPGVTPLPATMEVDYVRVWE